MPAAPDGPAGAYGLRLDGVRSRFLLAAPAGWPAVRVERTERDGERGTTITREMDAEHARFVLGRIELRLDRRERTAAIVHTGPVADDDVAHPLAGSIAAAFAHWDGAAALHAGGVAGGGAAWAVVGAMEAGKSTLMAALALAGRQVLADDMLVVRPGLVAAAGPRCADLRPPAAERLAAETVPARTGTRDRLVLGPVPAELPLAGWIGLEWGEEDLSPIAPAERFTWLESARKWGLPPRDPRLLLDLAALPAWRLRRPREWSSTAAAVAAVSAVVDGRG